jgi:hypothetical protein
MFTRGVKALAVTVALGAAICVVTNVAPARGGGHFAGSGHVDQRRQTSIVPVREHTAPGRFA